MAEMPKAKPASSVLENRMKQGLSPSRPSQASLGPDNGRANNVRHP